MASILQPLVPLAALLGGESGVVEEVLGQAADVLRLQELGIRTGQTVEVLQAGSPCIVRIAGNKLCFREGEACEVLVRLGPSS
jgi:Fe2+ transport system protein FeoA